LAISAVGVTTDAAGQESADSLRIQVERLTAMIDSLADVVERLEAGGRTGAPDDEPQDALARLRAAAEAAAAATPTGAGATPAAGGAAPTTDQEQAFVGRQRSLQALNPEISVNADVFGHINQDDAGQDNFFAREVEMSIISNLDPFSRAKIFVSRHQEGGEFTPFEHEGADEHEEGAGFAIEEGYVEWVGLPAGLGLKLGRFFQQFGQLNRWHAHALPFQTRSLPHLAILGEESLAQTGASVRWLAPFGGAAGTYEATVEVTRSENAALFGESGGISVLGHLNGFWILSESVDLDLGLSWIRGSYEDEVSSVDRSLYGTEVALTWRPPGSSRYRGLTVRGGAMLLDGLVPEVPAGGGAVAIPEEDHALGLWTAAEVRLSQSWLAGGRFDRTENPADPGETAWLVSPTLTWWQSEYVRLRLEYDLLGRSFQTGDEGRLFLQVTFAMGPHRHETY
jgi:hypothetical protein